MKHTTTAGIGGLPSERGPSLAVLKWRPMSEANVEIIRRHYEIRHSQGSKRREVGMHDWS